MGNPDTELWSEFHRAVNMSWRALGDWLRLVTIDPDCQPRPGAADLRVGYRILNLMRRPQVELDHNDLAFMRYVVDQVREVQRGGDVPSAGHAAWHRQLLLLGHDPVKAA